MLARVSLVPLAYSCGVRNPRGVSFSKERSGQIARAAAQEKLRPGRAVKGRARPQLSAICARQAALRRRVGALRWLRRLAVDLRRALPDRLAVLVARLAAVLFVAGLAAFCLAVFAMSSIFLSRWFFLPNTKRY